MLGQTLACLGASYEYEHSTLLYANSETRTYNNPECALSSQSKVGLEIDMGLLAHYMDSYRGRDCHQSVRWMLCKVKYIKTRRIEDIKRLPLRA